MSDGLNVNYSLNSYEDLSNYPINDSVDGENSAVFNQVKNIVKGTIFNNSQQLAPTKDFRARFISLKGSLNNKLKTIFHGVSESSSEGSEKGEGVEGKEKSEEDVSSERKGLEIEPEIDSFSEAQSAKESEIEEKYEIEKREQKELKEKDIEVKEKEPNEIEKSEVQESAKEQTQEEVKEKEIPEREEKLEESSDVTKEENQSDVESFSEKSEGSEDVSEEKEKIETPESKNEEVIEKVSESEHGKEEENKLKTDEEVKEELRLAEDSEGDSLAEIEQMEVEKEEKKEEHEEEHEKEEIEKKDEDDNLLSGISEINKLENSKEEGSGEEEQEDNKEEKKTSCSLKIPLDLISFIKQNLSKILAHKENLIENYDCIFYAEDVSVFFLEQFSDIMVTIFRSSVSSMEAEKIYQTRQKAKKFIQDNNLSFLQISDDKLLIINSNYGPIKILLEKRLSSGFVLSDLIGHLNYKTNKYLLKEALKQFVIFMCDFGLNSGFRYKLRILPSQPHSPASIALYCSYSISLANNFKLFKETLSVLSKEDFDFVFHIVESKLDNKKIDKILNYWKLKQ